jgi:hypothetical protein
VAHRPRARQRAHPKKVFMAAISVAREGRRAWRDDEAVGSARDGGVPVEGRL